MNAQEGKTGLINKIDQVSEELSLKDRIEVLQYVSFMVEMYIDEAIEEQNSNK